MTLSSLVTMLRPGSARRITQWIAPRMLILGGLACAPLAQAAPMTLFDGRKVAAIIHEDTPTMALAARLLARDLQALSGRTPVISTALPDCGAACVVIGRHDAAPAAAVAADAGLDLARLNGQWERHARVLVRTPGREMLLIAGSDARGAVWGMVDLGRELGVSAWEWWADVAPRRAARLEADGALRWSAAPSVQYRGIFLNDEDWGLQPWAAKTHEPLAKDIGPATYARVFELLWRLKANLIWPAMHDVTAPFYSVPGNAAMARDYAIVVGTSHAEPMMRNNVREWDKARLGAFNFFTNRDAMLGYWQERVDQVKGDEAMFSVGLRGVHDSAMEGAKTVLEARDGVAGVIRLQRAMLSASLGKPAQQIPQALTLYKEVLDVYQAGLAVPDDVTLVWPDDNYGYLQQLGTAPEARRSGGAGIYYHLSYWGRPHDYLWLGSTHPALVREQMERAWHSGARKAWIVNVGDIKPLEYLADYALGMAFDQGMAAQAPLDHLGDWAARQFGREHGAAVAALMTRYYDLAWERKPEFMGFGQTEPTTPNRPSAYLRTGGEEAERRLAHYRDLVRRAEALDAAMPPERRDAFFELVLYPVRASAALNSRILKLELAGQYARLRCAQANDYAADARAAQRSLVDDTARYNALAGGKWRHMMDLAPRRLPVFQEPLYPAWSGAMQDCAPDVLALKAADQARVASIAATEAVTTVVAAVVPDSVWEVVPGLGSRGASLRSQLGMASRKAAGPGLAAPLEYAFTQAAEASVRIKFVAVPTHALSSANRLRIAIQLDEQAPETLDFATRGRSEEWKLNVLSNSAQRTIKVDKLAPGRHRIRVFALDPGFILDRIDIAVDGAPDYYGAPPTQASPDEGLP